MELLPSADPRCPSLTGNPAQITVWHAGYSSQECSSVREEKRERERLMMAEDEGRRSGRTRIKSRDFMGCRVLLLLLRLDPWRRHTHAQ